VRKNFLVLLSLSVDDAAAAKAFMGRLLGVDPTCKAAWLDSRGAGVFVSTKLTAEGLKEACLPDGRPDWEHVAFRDAIILELGSDHWCRSGSKVDAWLGSHQTPSAAEDPKA